MDERMMTLFTLIADQVKKKQELFEDEGKIVQTLLGHGYRLQEADAALSLMQTLVQRQTEELFTDKLTGQGATMRAMSREERTRFSIEAFGFVTKLATLGIISDDQREQLLDRALIVYTDKIELDHIKSLVAFTLFVHPHEQDADPSAVSRHIRKTSWN